MTDEQIDRFGQDWLKPINANIMACFFALLAIAALQMLILWRLW